MAESGTAREEIIRRGAALIHRKGYNASGLQEILEKAKVPKGSFYFYFKSKEEFGSAVIDYFAEILAGAFSHCLTDQSLHPAERLEKLLDTFEAGYREKGYTLGCPIGNLALEMSDTSDLLRARINAAIGMILTSLESCLREARDDGSLLRDIDPCEAARFIFQGFEGALLHMKVSRSAEPLRIFKKFLFDYLCFSPSKRS